MHQSVVCPRGGGGVSGIPTGFDNYLLPLGEEFGNNMSPRVGNLRNLISHFSS